jgi:hypothetical protein
MLGNVCTGSCGMLLQITWVARNIYAPEETMLGIYAPEETMLCSKHYNADHCPCIGRIMDE